MRDRRPSCTSDCPVLQDVLLQPCAKPHLLMGWYYIHWWVSSPTPRALINNGLFTLGWKSRLIVPYYRVLPHQAGPVYTRCFWEPLVLQRAKLFLRNRLWAHLLRGERSVFSFTPGLNNRHLRHSLPVLSDLRHGSPAGGCLLHSGDSLIGVHVDQDPDDQQKEITSRRHRRSAYRGVQQRHKRGGGERR